MQIYATSPFDAFLSTQNLRNFLDDKDTKNTETKTQELTSEEKEVVRELQSIDAEVRAHEAAHMAVGGSLAGGASYEYTRGPDGKMYATSGEVPINMSSGNSPEETIRNAQQVQAAAMAPSNPSPQDYKVAASAAQMEIQARMELSKERAEEAKQAEETRQNTENTSDNESTKTTQNAFSIEDNERKRAIESYTQSVTLGYSRNTTSFEMYA